MLFGDNAVDVDFNSRPTLSLTGSYNFLMVLEGTDSVDWQLLGSVREPGAASAAMDPCPSADITTRGRKYTYLPT